MFTTDRNHTAPTASNDCTPTGCAAGRTRQRRWYTVVAAMASANVAYTVIDPLLGIELTVPGGSGQIHVGLLAVTLSSLVAGYAAWALLALLERLMPRARDGQPRTPGSRTLRPRTVWTWIAVATYVVSLTGPLGAASTSAVAALAALHTIVAAVLVVGMRRAS